MERILKRFLSRFEKPEHGFTMVEVLVAIALLGVVTSVVTATILNTTKTSDNFAQGAMNESELLNAVSLISRDISLATSIDYAAEDALAATTIDGDETSKVFYFYWMGNNASGAVADLPQDGTYSEVRTNASKLPAGPGIVEYRIANNDTSNPIIRNLVNGYNPGGNAEFPLFTYFDNTNTVILLDASNPPKVSDDHLKTIRRVEIHFTSYVTGRNNAMELHTSAVPRLLGTATNTQANTNAFSEQKLQAPTVNGELPARTNTAKLWWAPVAGTDYYIVYRAQDNAATWTEISTLEGVGTTTYTNANLAWGSDYAYKVVAFDHRGGSDDSNLVRMRVTPEPTQFINVESKRGQNGESAAGYTVARQMSNYLAWEESAGPNTKYTIRASKNGGTKTVIFNNETKETAVHSGHTYGDVSVYWATAFNDVVTVNNPDGTVRTTGGTAVESASVDLISPPIRPTVSVETQNDIDGGSSTPRNVVKVTNGSSIATELGFNVYRSGSADPNNNSIEEGSIARNGTSLTDDLRDSSNYSSNEGWGSHTRYAVYAYNDAGESPVSNVARANQPPGPFEISSLANPTAYGHTFSQNDEMSKNNTVEEDGTMTGKWTDSKGAGKFSMSRAITKNYGTAEVPRSIVAIESGISSIHSSQNSFTVEGVNPGVVYTVTMVSTAAHSDNDRTRTAAKKTLLTRPDVPRSGKLEAMCLANDVNGSAQTYSMYVDADTRPLYGKADKTEVTYHVSGGSSSSKDATPRISSSTFAFQRIDKYQVGRINFRNILTDDLLDDNVADYGTSESERRGMTLYLETVVISSFNGACNNANGTEVPKADAYRISGYGWVVPRWVCYGFRANVRYEDFYVRSASPMSRAYTYGDMMDLVNKGTYSRSDFVRSGDAGLVGCNWRLDPEIGAEPKWYAKTRGNQ